MNAIDHGRRKFLWESAALAGIALAPGITLYDLAHGRAPAAPASNAVRWGLLVDMNQCAPGCDACVTACDKENGLPGTKRATDAQWIRKIDLTDLRGRVRSLPMMCQHCADPPCVDVCPTGASFKRADGIVLVDRHTCIGCRYCVMACPYGARSFVHEPVANQKPDVPRGKGCVEDTPFMRRNHMELLKHQRDRTVHDGIRTIQHSLANCITCHAGKKTGRVTGSDGFCQSCHSYAGVVLDCFECHADKPKAAMVKVTP